MVHIVELDDDVAAHLPADLDSRRHAVVEEADEARGSPSPSRRRPARMQRATPPEPTVEDVTGHDGFDGAGAAPVYGHVVQPLGATLARKHAHERDDFRDGDYMRLRKSPRMAASQPLASVGGLFGPAVMNLGAAFDACVHNILGHVWGLAGPDAGLFGAGDVLPASMRPPGPSSIATTPPESPSPPPSMQGDFDASEAVAPDMPMAISASPSPFAEPAPTPSAAEPSRDRSAEWLGYANTLAAQFAAVYLQALQQPDASAVCALLHPEALVSVGGAHWVGAADGGVALHAHFAGALPEFATIDAQPLGNDRVLVLATGFASVVPAVGAVPVRFPFSQQFVLAPVNVNGGTSYVVTNSSLLAAPS